MTTITRLMLALSLVFAGALAAPAQDYQTEMVPPDATAEMPGQTLEDILARQEGLTGHGREPRDFEAAVDNAASGPLGTLGGISDSVMWDGLRFGTAPDMRVSAGGDVAKVIMQDGGMWWWDFRAGQLATWGGYWLLAVIGLIAVFYFVKGRIKISGGLSGREILRFDWVERFGHWLIASSFLILGVTGLLQLYARKLLMTPPDTPGDLGNVLARQDGFSAATVLGYTKWIHNNISWAFMIGIVMIFVLWIAHNIPNKTDLKWLAKGGGFIGNTHPPAKKFNAGQKLIFWSVILLGGSISVSGLSLLFPYQLPMFEPTFAKLNDFGIPELLGRAQPFPGELTPQEEMQYAQLWHSIVSFVLLGIVIAHIYIGSIGMQGAWAAMGRGRVDYNWAKDHHSLWVEEVEARQEGKAGRPKAATPAE
ncbi:formate dehydrogenase subunit gamma [Palleronia sediminis]|nr:formate dehydrogenase subunit gamma [Palleronia sediminis]